MADLFGGSLFDDFRRLQQEMDDLFGSRPRTASIRAGGLGAYPPINVGSTPEKVDVYIFAAGLDPKSIDLSIQKNLLTISGSRDIPAQDDVDYYRRERFSGEFRRAVTLPDDVDSEHAKAKYRDGVLHISVARKESSRPRRIDVN